MDTNKGTEEGPKEKAVGDTSVYIKYFIDETTGEDFTVFVRVLQVAPKKFEIIDAWREEGKYVPDPETVIYKKE